MLESNENSIRSISEAITEIENYTGKVEDFELPISVELLDTTGIAMAIITDKILAKGWIPDGYTEGISTRIFRYAK
jgi:hypothetical protein